MKFKFGEDTVFWMIVLAVSLPICGAIGYLIISSEVGFFRHPAEHPDLYQRNMNLLALLIFAALGFVVSVLARWRSHRNRNHNSE